MIASLKFLLYCIGVAVAYGIIHDQVTARVCVEYFTIGHPPIFNTDSPTLLAFGWGVLATWWGGLIIGSLLLVASLIGPWRRYPLRRLYRPVALVMIAAAPIALAAGIVGYNVAQAGNAPLPEPYAARIPAEHHSAFIADLFAHNASYAIGFLGGFGLCAWVLVRRIVGGMNEEEMREEGMKDEAMRNKVMKKGTLAALLIACSLPAHAQRFEGAYYIGTLGDDTVSVEMSINGKEPRRRFNCEIAGGSDGFVTISGFHRGGRCAIRFLSIDHREMLKGLPGSLVSLRLGDRSITGIIPDSSRMLRRPLAARRVAMLRSIDRLLPNDGALSITYPRFVDGDGRLMRSINDTVEAYVRKVLRFTEPVSSADPASNAEEAYDNTQLHYNLSISILNYSPDLITLMADHDTRYNGGHSFDEFEGLNFVRDGDVMRRVYLRDLFLPGTPYPRRLRELAARRADSLARLDYADSPEVFEVYADELDAAQQAVADSIADERLDELERLEEDLGAFTIEPDGSLSITSLCHARYPIYETVSIDIAELADLIDPKGPLARFLTGDERTHR